MVTLTAVSGVAVSVGDASRPGSKFQFSRGELRVHKFCMQCSMHLVLFARDQNLNSHRRGREFRVSPYGSIYEHE